MKSNKMKKLNKQDGSALLVTIIALLVVTVVALAATNSNQIQSIMVRNNQFRLEAFNNSYTEIDAQIDAINNTLLSEGVPSYILALIDNNVGTVISDTEIDPSFLLEFRSTVENGYVDRSVSKVYRGICPTFGQQLGDGKATVICNEILIISNNELQNTNISSDQNQVYKYRTLAEQ